MTEIIVTENISEYRVTIPVCVNKDDAVLEVGCANGKTTSILAEHCKEAVGIDKGGTLPRARERYPRIQFEQIDGFDIGAILALGKNFNKIYMDISGNRDLDTVISMIQKQEAAFSPELIVVKSSKLKRILREYKIWEDIFENRE